MDHHLDPMRPREEQEVDEELQWQHGQELREGLQALSTRSVKELLDAGGWHIHPKWHPNKELIDKAYFTTLCIDKLPEFEELCRDVGGIQFVRDYLEQMLDFTKDSHWRAITSILIQSVVTYHITGPGAKPTRKSESDPHFPLPFS
jgi:hypothetical protein